MCKPRRIEGWPYESASSHTSNAKKGRNTISHSRLPWPSRGNYLAICFSSFTLVYKFELEEMLYSALLIYKCNGKMFYIPKIVVMLMNVEK